MICKDHRFDLIFALAFWEAQGEEFEKVVLCLRQSKGLKRQALEKLCVEFSSIRAASRIKCFALKKTYSKPI